MARLLAASWEAQELAQAKPGDSEAFTPDRLAALVLVSRRPGLAEDSEVKSEGVVIECS